MMMRANTKKNSLSVRKVTYLVVTLSIIAYALFNSRFFIAGPSIVIEEPQNGGMYEEGLITISGKAKRLSSLTINDHPVFMDRQGFFTEKLLLSPGVVIIEVEGRDRFDRMSSQTLQLVISNNPLIDHTLPEEMEILEESVDVASTSDIEI